MKLKTLKKKIRKLEARLQEGPAKLARLKRKLAAATIANAKKAKKKAAARAPAESLTPIQKRKGGPTGQPPVKSAAAKRRSPAKKEKRKLNLTPERRAELAAAMKARWAAKRAAEAKPQNSSTGGDFTLEQVPPARVEGSD